MIGSIREILSSVLAAQLDCKKITDGGKSTGSCRFLALPSQNGDTLRGPPYTSCYARFPPFLTPLCQESLGVNAAPLTTEIHRNYKALTPFDAAVLCLPIRSHQPHLAVTTIGRSQYSFSIVGEAVES